MMSGTHGMKAEFVLLHLAPVDNPKFPAVEYGEIGVTSLYGDGGCNSDIRGV